MDKSEHTKPSADLLARLHDACRPSFSPSAFAMRAQGEGDYLVPNRANKSLVAGGSTLGDSIRRKQQNS